MNVTGFTAAFLMKDACTKYLQDSLPLWLIPGDKISHFNGF